MAKAPREKNVTIHDVAKDAGVSFSAVSKVMRNAYGVSDALREKVNVSIAKLGYTPSMSARGISGGRTFVIGVVFPDMRNPFFADILAGVSSALERTTYQMVQGIVQHSSEAALVQSMTSMQLDGLIIVGSVSTSQALSALAARIPLVLIGHHLPEVSAFDTVNNDDAESGRLAVRHFVENGYRKIAMLSLDSPNGTVIQRREEGYIEAMKAADLGKNIEIVRTPQNLREIQGAAQRLLSGPNRKDAIFCWTDYVALETLSVAGIGGLAVPGDVGVIGHDNTMYCAFDQNSLTSIDQSGEQLGLQATRLLVERIEGRQKAEHFLVHPRLVARRSSALSQKA
ncbi:LacI family transcriptional regulator [Devosia sp. Root685]|uniref:LacI family DNA-binding transcriptional regulator n=1 Tax=Devosia sp. Root685 TaxID=1736587 RepID=UPI0006F73920|nr:LacI family DNA-binding transcriptional regulator [Devosia sp. Root685]KRA98028.1 LacI family transcriptional regulator [Devosia sp. Root685]